MKRLILCFDGTWNTPDDDDAAAPVETNARRFYESVAPAGRDGVAQSPSYFPGVGTGGGLVDRITGGVFGAGLGRKVIEGYERLVEQYEDGDEIYLLGFSRGAFTARSLAGMIRKSGLVRVDAGLGARSAYTLYRSGMIKPDAAPAVAFRDRFSRAPRIHFLGVWDTVGALGIPVAAAGRLNAWWYQFHDTELSSIVERAYHAVALDEHRRDFRATLWAPKEKPGQAVEQRWFVGSHSDVGGGEEARGLSDLALAWLQGRAAEAGLGLDEVRPGEDSPFGALTDSYSTFLKGRYPRLGPRFYRPVKATMGNETIDPTVDARRRRPGLDYRPSNDGLPGLES